MIYQTNVELCDLLNKLLNISCNNPTRQGLNFPTSGPPTREVAHPWFRVLNSKLGDEVPYMWTFKPCQC